MFGSRLDYYLLQGIAHRRNLSTEDQLDSAFSQISDETYVSELPKFAKLIERFEGHLRLSSDLRYLDIGCGTGELSIAVARNGGGSVTGIDFLPRSIQRAQALAARLGVSDQEVRFICHDVHAWCPTASERYDVLLSFDALEHIDNPRRFLAKMADLVTPGGVAVLAFGPLFHSPFGDHMWDFFRIQIPWRGVLFPERAMLRVRRECFRPTDPAIRYREIAGGLNQMRYSDFLNDVRASGWEFEFLAVNTFLREHPVLRRVSALLMAIPLLQDYFAHNVYAVLRRAEPTRAPQHKPDGDPNKTSRQKD